MKRRDKVSIHSDKIEFKTKIGKRNKEEYNMIRRSIPQKYITIHIYTPKNRPTEYIRKKTERIKGNYKSSTVTR
jgi:hypothetical protein